MKRKESSIQYTTRDENRHLKLFLTELPRTDGFIDFSQLQRVGRGGTHDVFIYPKNPSFVIKLDKWALKKAIDVAKSKLPIEIRAAAERYTEDENNKNEELCQYFGQEHCLREIASVQKIKFEQDGVIQNIEGVIIIQKASDLFKNIDSQDFGTQGYYLEKDSIAIEQNKNIYERMNNALFSDGEFIENDFLKLYQQLILIFNLIDKDSNFANSIKEFLLKFKSYFEATGRFIDLVGKKNVLFYKQTGEWTFMLGSVVKEEDKNGMREAMGELEKSPKKLNEDQGLKNQLMNQLTLIRILNATGLKVGVGKIIDVKLSEKQLKNLETIQFTA